MKIYITTAPTCFGAVTPSSGSALLVLAKVTVVKIEIKIYWCVVMWLYILVGPCWCVYVALFGSRLSLPPNSATYTHQQESTPEQCNVHTPTRVYSRTVQRTHTNKDPLIYAATSPHTDIF